MEQWKVELPEMIKAQAKIDKQVVFECEFSKPNAKVKWFKGKKEIFVSCRCVVIYPNGLIVISFFKICLCERRVWTVWGHHVLYDSVHHYLYEQHHSFEVQKYRIEEVS